MSQPSQTSPNILNYLVGKGVCTWQPQGSGTVYDLGNSPRFEVTPKVQKLDHWSHRLGTRFKDLAVALTKEAEIVITLDEFSYENLSLAFMGSISGTTVNILDLANLQGQLVFTGTNNVGPRKLITLPNVVMFPNGKVDFISNEWGEIELQGELLGDPVSGSFGTIVDAP